jgi:hypothetical protein
MKKKHMYAKQSQQKVGRAREPSATRDAEARRRDATDTATARENGIANRAAQSTKPKSKHAQA